jgi:hypothetical protein
VCRLLVRANVPSSPILVTLMKEALSSSETSALTRGTRRKSTEDAILHSHRRENLKSYIELNVCISPFQCLSIHNSRQASPSCNVLNCNTYMSKIRNSAVAQVVSHRLPTAAARGSSVSLATHSLTNSTNCSIVTTISRPGLAQKGNKWPQ